MLEPNFDRSSWVERGSLSRKTAEDLHKNAIHFYRQTEQRTQLPAKTHFTEGEGAPRASVICWMDEDRSMKYFSISPWFTEWWTRGDSVVLWNIYNTCARLYSWRRNENGADEWRSRWGWRERERERKSEHNRLLVAWFEYKGQCVIV